MLKESPINESMSLDGEALARRCVDICVDRKAENIVLYDMTGASMLTDYYVICNGNSEPHLRAISVHLGKELSKQGIRSTRVDGSAASRWIVMDFGLVIIHIFHPDMRHFYELEKLLDPERLLFKSEDQPTAGSPGARQAERPHDERLPFQI